MKKSKPGVLYTIGYQGRTLEDILSLFDRHSVPILVDVRELPLSRKNGFSKTALSSFCDEHEMQYIHFRELGSPKQLRERLRSDGDKAYFKRHFKKHLAGAISFLKEVASFLDNNSIVLLCYEADASDCHRSFVAEGVSKISGSQIVHL